MVLAAIPIGRIGQGLAGVGSKYAPQIGSGIAQGVSQGTGAAIGWAGANLVAQPIKGVKGLVLNLVPENFLGFYVWAIIVTYWASWLAGFATTRVWVSHSVLGILGFIIFLLTDGLSWQTFRKYGVTFSILIIVDYLLLTGRAYWQLILVAAVLLAFREGSPVEDFKRVLLVIAIATIGNKMYAQIIGLVAPQIAKLPLNLGYVPYIGAVLLNRTITFPYLWFAIFGLNKQTRVARSLAWFVMLLVLFAFWPQISPEVSKVRGQYAGGATAEQQAVVPDLFQKAVIGIRSFGASLGSLISVKTVSAYDRAEELYGFGSADKEQPLIGLELIDDPNRPPEGFDLNIPGNTPTPGVILHVLNPLPSDMAKRFIDVVGVSCKDNSKNPVQGVLIKPLTSDELEKNVEQEAKNQRRDSGLIVNYRSLVPVKCEFASMAEGDKTVEFKVNYRLSGSAELSTAFMRSDKLDAILQNRDPKVLQLGLKEIPLAKARYDNGPVAITWGDLRLPNPPVRVDVEKKNELELVVYVVSRGTWPGEIAGIENIELTMPSGITLNKADPRCMFEGGAEVYDVPKKFLLIDENKAATPDNLKFIGKGFPFTCGIILEDDLLNADWVGAQFKVKVDYLFSTKKQVSFKVIGKVVTEGDLCSSNGSGGKWDATSKRCDCGAQKQFDAQTKMCVDKVQSSVSQPPAAAPQPAPSSSSPATGSPPSPQPSPEASLSQAFPGDDEAMKKSCSDSGGSLVAASGGWLQCDCTPKVYNNGACQ